MSQLTELFQILKQQLKYRHVTYCDLADQLGLSEASVKRLFSQKNMTLDRLEQLCSCINLSLVDLFQLVDELKQPILKLSHDQEKRLVSDKKLLLVTICVLNHWQWGDILTRYKISSHELTQCLATLDSMRIIELQPNNRIRCLFNPNFHWLPNGPIQHFFQKNVLNDFFSSRFDRANEALVVRCGMLSEDQNQQLQEELQALANKFTVSCRESKKVAIDERAGSALVIALRPWAPKAFDELRFEK